jgi:hypothetical protein
MKNAEKAGVHPRSMFYLPCKPLSVKDNHAGPHPGLGRQAWALGKEMENSGYLGYIIMVNPWKTCVHHEGRP